MSRNGTLLPLPSDMRLSDLRDEWPSNRFMFRSDWLRAFEDILHEWYPQASSASLRLTARHYAPFPLAAGHNVP